MDGRMSNVDITLVTHRMACKMMCGLRNNEMHKLVVLLGYLLRGGRAQLMLKDATEILDIIAVLS